jgi:hypothetical protein
MNDKWPHTIEELYATVGLKDFPIAKYYRAKKNKRLAAVVARQGTASARKARAKRRRNRMAMVNVARNDPAAHGQWENEQYIGRTVLRKPSSQSGEASAGSSVSETRPRCMLCERIITSKNPDEHDCTTIRTLPSRQSNAEGFTTNRGSKISTQLAASWHPEQELRHSLEATSPDFTPPMASERVVFVAGSMEDTDASESRSTQQNQVAQDRICDVTDAQVEISDLTHIVSATATLHTAEPWIAKVPVTLAVKMTAIVTMAVTTMTLRSSAMRS